MDRFKVYSKSRIPTGKVKIEIFNMLGLKVATILDKLMQTGSHEVTFNAQDLTSGIYSYKITFIGILLILLGNIFIYYTIAIKNIFKIKITGCNPL